MCDLFASASERNLMRAAESTAKLLDAAREIAGTVMEARGRGEDAKVIRSGGGDDFAEVAIALAAIGSTRELLGRLDRAVRYYADPELWDEEGTGFSLAYYDQGLVARATLSGKDILTEWE